MRVSAWMGAAAVVWCAASCLGEPIADVIWWEEPLFTVEDVDVIDRAAVLTPEQRRGMEDLMFSGMAEARRAASEAKRGLRDRLGDLAIDQLWAEEADSRRIGAKSRLERLAPIPGVLEAERETLAAVWSLLTAEQDRAAWSEYERYRVRRGALSAGMGAGRAADPVLENARRAGLRDEEISLLRPVQTDLSGALDPLAARSLRAFRASLAERREKLEKEALGAEAIGPARPRGSTAATQENVQVGLEIDAAISRAHVRAAELLPDGARMKYKRARAADVIDLFGSDERPTTAETLTRNWGHRVSLTAEQKRAIADLAKAAWEDVVDLAVAELGWYDESAAAKKGWNTDALEPGWTEKNRAVMERAKREALAVLTPEQRRVVDSQVESREQIEAVFERRAGEPSR
ncbi:MAG: hypothetical protein K2Q20_04875 [Phycisphaerales bacterium]|nr:hypothetical protein [Phycisphaerales bacterium]